MFDVFGTLVDWRSSLIETGEALAAGAGGTRADWPAIIDEWRHAYQPALDRVLAGEPWRDLDSLQRETLGEILSRRGVTLPAASADALVRGWRRLRPWPDSRRGLDRLRRGYLTATLSNGHIALLADLLKFAGLRVDALLSAQLAGAYKPDPRAYLEGLRLLDCRPEEAGMVAAHAGDLRAAATLGIRPLFVARPAEWGPGGQAEEPPALDGLLACDGLAELADALGC